MDEQTEKQLIKSVGAAEEHARATSSQVGDIFKKMDVIVDKMGEMHTAMEVQNTKVNLQHASFKEDIEELEMQADQNSQAIQAFKNDRIKIIAWVSGLGAGLGAAGSKLATYFSGGS